MSRLQTRFLAAPHRFVLVGLVVAFACACTPPVEEETDASQEPPRPTLDEAQRFALETATSDLAEARKRAAVGESVAVSCAAILSYVADLHAAAEQDESARALVTDATQFCRVAAPLRALELAVERAEAAHAVNPEAMDTACFSARFTTALEDLAAAGQRNDPRVAELEARFDRVCPRR